MRDDQETIDRTGRVLGFSLAAADLFVELDQRFHVIYASGAASQIAGFEPEALIDIPFRDLVAPEDRPIVDRILARLTDETRPPPETVRLALTGATALLGACTLATEPGQVFITLSTARSSGHSPSFGTTRDSRTGALVRDDFVVAARDLVFGARELGVQAVLTLMRFSGDDLSGRGAIDVVQHLRSVSFGDAVGRMSDCVFAVVHDDAVGLDVLAPPSTRATTSQAESVLAYCHTNLNAEGLSPQDAADVIAYAITQFVEAGPKAREIGSLSNGMKLLVRETLDRLAALKQTVFNREFSIVFQPIVSLATETVHHYEVLSRFPDGDPPDRTVAFAESTGLIEDLDLAVCKKAVEVMHDGMESGTPLSLAVNISARSLRSRILVDALDQLMASLGAQRSSLMLEVTETHLIEDLGRAENVLQRFRAAGHPVCLDDVGAGAASFQYFQALTIDYAKIDGSYIHQVLTRDRDAAILRAMVSLCRDLEVKTVAEMIENVDQAAKLKEIGIDFGQGWFFGRPEPEIPLIRSATAPA